MHDFFNTIVVIAIVLAIVYLRRGRHRPQPMDRISGSSRESELELEVRQLRDRIAVLERIATDERKSRSIAQEIEALRDPI